MKRLIPIAAAMALLVAGCADQGETPTESFAPPTVSPTPDATIEPSPAPTETAEATRGAIGDETISGTLGGDDIEGGCVFVTTADGTNYEVIWPEGWEIEFETMELRDDTGEVVATGGDQLTLHGRIAQDQMSICQIGPLFEADQLEVEE